VHQSVDWNLSLTLEVPYSQSGHLGCLLLCTYVGQHSAQIFWGNLSNARRVGIALQGFVHLLDNVGLFFSSGQSQCLIATKYRSVDTKHIKTPKETLIHPQLPRGFLSDLVLKRDS